jgi:hypothetical protein
MGMNTFLNLNTEQEFNEWYDNATPDELKEFEAWHAANAKTLEEINLKAKDINQGLNIDLHPVELAQLYDNAESSISPKAIASHYTKIAQSKKNPNKKRALELIEQFKATGDKKFIKSAWTQFDKERPNIYTLESFRTLYKRKK